MYKKINDEFSLELLYSNEIKNKLLLLNKIYRAKNGLSVDELAIKTSLSGKTVYKYIRDMNELSYNFFDDLSITIYTSTNYSFKGDKNKFLTLRYLIIEQCEALQLLLALIPNSSVNKYDFCSRYFLSDSTLKKNIRKINSLFNYLNIKIITRKNEIYLTGNEAIIRYCFTAIVWRTYNGLKWPFESLLSTVKLIKIKRKLFINSKYTIPLPKQDIFMVQIAISVLRINSSNQISVKELPSYVKDVTSSFLHMDEFKKSLRELFFFDSIEIDFILLNIFLYPEREAIYENNYLTLAILKNKNSSAFQSINKFINFIKEKHPNWDTNSITAKVTIASIISAHIALDLYKQACFNWQDLNLISFVSDNFPMLIPSIKKLTACLNPKLSEDLISALAFNLTKAYLLEFSPKDFEPEINILLLSDSPAYVERETVYKIKSILRYKFNIKISTTDLPNKSFDLLIATAMYKDNPQNIPTVYVFPQIIEKDVQNIKEKCEEVYINKIKNHQIYR